jgi:hypothetical protein
LAIHKGNPSMRLAVFHFYGRAADIGTALR